MRQEYAARINRVIDYIESHLDQDLSLASLADVACFSPFHFHRIFRAFTGETLNRFILRIRLQKAANQLLTNPGKPVTDIALDCGFSGSAVFARSFKGYFGMSASQWRLEAGDIDSKNCKYLSKTCKGVGKVCEEIIRSFSYIDKETQNLCWRIEMKQEKKITVEIMEMPEFQVAYVRHVGPYKGDSRLFEALFNRLMTWAGPRGLMGGDARVLTVYHDDPKLVQEDKLRVSACITIEKDMPVEGEIGKMNIPGGKFVVAGFEISDPGEYEKAWDMVYGQWLPGSGFQPDDRLCYEICKNDPKTHPKGHHLVDICIPVKPL